MTGADKKTVLRLLIEVGDFCMEYQDTAFRNLNCRRIQVDECWQFVYAKQKNVTPEIAARQIAGDTWLWCAIDADTKLVPAWTVGPRSAGTAHDFMNDLAARLSHRVQLTSDGLKLYLEAVDYAFSGMIDYAMLVKIYGSDPKEERRYSPAQCIACETHRISGNPDPKHISTSYIERQNLSCTDDQSAFYAVDKRIQQEDRESCGRDCVELLRIQLHQDSPHPTRHSGNGRWRHRSAVGC
jgi:IS1 family transposase